MLAPLATRAKSPEAFRTISEVAAELDVPQHVLRFWETRFAQVRPVKRAGARRYYRPEDVDLLRGIRALLYVEGFTIRGVQKVLRDKGLRHVAGIGRASIRQEPDEFESAVAEIDDDRASETVTRLVVVQGNGAEAPTAVRVDQPPIVRVTVADQETREAPVAGRLSAEQRAGLEVILADLLQLKTRLRASGRIKVVPAALR